MKRVLIVTPAFPPLNTPDLHRVRLSLPYYRENNWEPTVLTVSPDYIDAAREPGLLETIPANINVVHTRALPLRFCRLIGLGNLGARAWLHLFFSGSRLLSREKFDLVFISNSQHLTFTLGRLWRFLHGVPYVIDLQDPWRTDFYERPGAPRPPGGWKYQLARLQASVLERWSFRRLGALMSVSPDYIKALRARYPWLDAVPCVTLGFGASETDLAVALRTPSTTPRPPAPANAVRIVYTGAAGPIMHDAVRKLFEAAKNFAQQHPADAARLSFEFFGTSYAAPGQGRPTLPALAAEYGLAHQVHEVAERLSHHECLRLQASADLLLLLGSSEPSYSPSKIFPYFLARRPTLALIHSKSLLAQLLPSLNFTRTITYDTSDASQALILLFRDALAGFPTGTLPERAEAHFKDHALAPALTRRQCVLFERALNPQSEARNDAHA